MQTTSGTARGHLGSPGSGVNARSGKPQLVVETMAAGGRDARKCPPRQSVDNSVVAGSFQHSSDP